ncbi:acyltransferase [Metapseudomonas sp. CR1201]
MKKIRKHGWRKGLSLYLFKAVQRIRVLHYRLLSENTPREMRGRLKQPALFCGQGEILIGKSSIGVWPSPFFLNGYAHIEAREPGARVRIGQGCHINNNAVLIAERNSISIGDNTLIGHGFSAYDSDFHRLEPHLRSSGQHEGKDVDIGNNVFIGANVTVLKGVTIGDNSVIANGSLVNRDIPANVIAGGVPAKVLGPLPD